VLGLRYETTPAQLRDVLVKLSEMLLGHPRVSQDSTRVRFVGFGDSALNVEVNAYVVTTDWQEFLEVREDILLRMMEIIERAGTAIAFPSRTLYLSRDSGQDVDKVHAVEGNVPGVAGAGTSSIS
jgi:MscS family membrane protein